MTIIFLSQNIVEWDERWRERHLVPKHETCGFESNTYKKYDLLVYHEQKQSLNGYIIQFSNIVLCKLWLQ